MPTGRSPRAPSPWPRPSSRPLTRRSTDRNLGPIRPLPGQASWGACRPRPIYDNSITGNERTSAMQQELARKRHWTLADIPWQRFDASKVDPEILKVVKAAAMVEHNGRDYADYLCNVFADDPAFQDVARGWAEEEVQHGQVLAEWARLADSSFDFESAFKRFTDGFKIETTAKASIRGSRSAELVARCIV